MTSCTYHAKAKANALSKYSRVSVLVSVVSVRDTANMEKVEKEDITHQDRTPQEELIYLIRLQGVLLGCTHPHQDKCPQDSTLPVSTRRQCLEHSSWILSTGTLSTHWTCSRTRIPTKSR